VVNEPAPSSATSRRRCGFASATRFFAGLVGRRPRRSASALTAASSASISTSSNRFNAPARSSGKKWRCCEVVPSGPALPFRTAEGTAAVTVGGAEVRCCLRGPPGWHAPDYAAGGSSRQQLAGVALRSGALYGLPAASDACLSPVPVVVMVRVVVVVTVTR